MGKNTRVFWRKWKRITEFLKRINFLFEPLFSGFDGFKNKIYF